MDEHYVNMLEEQVKRLKLVGYLTNALNSMENQRELLDYMLDECIKITRATSGSIMLKKGESPILVFEAARNYSGIDVKNVEIKIGDGVVGVVMQEGIPKLVSDVELEPKYITLIPSVQSEIAVPLIISGKAQGVLTVSNTQKNAFTEFDVELLQNIANVAAQVLNRSRLTQTLERKVKLQQILINISNNVDKVTEIKDTFELVIKKLADSFKIVRGMLVLFEKVGFNELSVASAYNLTEEEILRGNYKVGEGIVGKVVQTGQPISIKDINKDPTFLNRMQVKRDKDIPTSFIAIPIKSEGICIGVLAVEKFFESEETLKDEQDMIFLIGNLISNKIRAYRKVQQERNMLMEENLQLKKELYKTYGFENIIGKNPKMAEVFELVKIVSESQASVLVLGESGTGKEVVAKAIHFNSPRKDMPFISINCAAIPENLLESELFGYKKGAFTGASIDKKGKFMLANKGTIFLDEIGDLPMSLQAKLLRAVQEREIEPIGSESKIKLDIRIISATNRNLEQQIAEGKFREDLYYRLNVVEVKIPPLRERKDDIPLFVAHFIKKYCQINNRKIEGMLPEASRLLLNYSWPGNVRELENVIERAVVLSRGGVIESSNLPNYLMEKDDSQLVDITIDKWLDSFIRNDNNFGNVYPKVIEYVEKELITRSLIFNDRNKVKTSDFLGINRNTLRFKINDYKINV